MTAKRSRTWVLWIFLALAGCATPLHQRLNDVSAGMDKSAVIDAVGNPKRTQRLNNGDLWTYVFYVGDRRYERDVRFESGQVVNISAAREILDDPKTGDMILKDYENLVNEAEKNKSAKDPNRSE